MASINEKRAFVLRMYPGKGWKSKVNKMSDIQVTAIYLKQQAKGEPRRPKENNHDDIPF